MKNLLFINGHMNPGGAEKSLLDILKHLDYSQYHVELLLLEELGSYASEIPKEVEIRLFDLHNTYGSVINSVKRCIEQKDWGNLWVRLVFLSTRFGGIDKIKWAAKTIVGTKIYDCVIAFRPGIATSLAAYAVHTKKRITWWHHGEINLNEDQQKEYELECREMDCVIAVSNGCAKMLTEHFTTLKDKIIVIPNMIDIDQLLDKADAYVPFEKQCGVCNIVTVSNLSPEKHIENVIAAAKVFAKQGKRFRWFVVGDGVQKIKLEEQVKKNALAEYVFFVGSKENPYPYMKRADMVAHTSYVESQCLVVLEAMALGTPCVVTKSIGTKEFCIDGINCILVEQGLEALIIGIARMWDSLESNQTMILNGKSTVANYGADIVNAKIQKALE